MDCQRLCVPAAFIQMMWAEETYSLHGHTSKWRWNTEMWYDIRDWTSYRRRCKTICNHLYTYMPYMKVSNFGIISLQRLSGLTTGNAYPPVTHIDFSSNCFPLPTEGAQTRCVFCTSCLIVWAFWVFLNFLPAWMWIAFTKAQGEGEVPKPGGNDACKPPSLLNSVSLQEQQVLLTSVPSLQFKSSYLSLISSVCLTLWVDSEDRRKLAVWKTLQLGPEPTSSIIW